jgi:uncharacterized repeat protein (TIGR03803 family)
VYTPVVLFQGTNGLNPQASLTLGPDGNLYGTTANGGPGGGGTLFRVVLTPSFTGIEKLPDGNVLLTGSGIPNSTFRLWTAESLSTLSAFSTLLATNVFDPDGKFSFTDETATNSAARFYLLSN